MQQTHYVAVLFVKEKNKAHHNVFHIKKYIDTTICLTFVFKYILVLILTH